MYTQSENIADNSGLRQAFFAYKKYIQENGEEKPLHRTQQFSAEQLFFISYAMVCNIFIYVDKKVVRTYFESSFWKKSSAVYIQLGPACLRA